jgi:HEAT repeat protein
MALRTLQGLGVEAEPAIPALRAALDDPDARVRRLAGEVLGKLEAGGRLVPDKEGR